MSAEDEFWKEAKGVAVSLRRLFSDRTYSGTDGMAYQALSAWLNAGRAVEVAAKRYQASLSEEDG